MLRTKNKKPKTPVALLEDEPGYVDDSSDTTSSWDPVEEEGYDVALETLEEVFETACAQLERQGWRSLAINDRRRELNEAEAALNKEEQEAIEAEFAAEREKEEYEEVLPRPECTLSASYCALSSLIPHVAAKRICTPRSQLRTGVRRRGEPRPNERGPKNGHITNKRGKNKILGS